MSLAKLINGFHQALLDRDALFLATISKEYEIPIDELQKIVYDVIDDPKNNKKSFKPQARQPKRKGGKEKKPDRQKSGYHLFCKSIKKEVERLLINDPEERLFKDRNGELVEIDDSTFEKGLPTFTHTTKKCAAMWWLLTDEERTDWKLKAQVAGKLEVLGVKSETVKNSGDEDHPSLEDFQTALEKALKKEKNHYTATVASENSDEEEKDNDEDNDEEEESEKEDDDEEEGEEESEKEKAPKKAPAKTKAPVKAAVSKTPPPKKAAPPKKGEGRVKNTPAPKPAPKTANKTKGGKKGK
jgi:hypothetical protein